MIPNAPNADTWAIYVHFPFCRHRCAYCDFATVAAEVIPRRGYTDAILAELTLRCATLEPRPISTVYFGGGTPSLWGPSHVAEVLRWLHDWGGLRADAEITLEANPGASPLEALAAYPAAGINRLSVGVQAVDDKRLRALDRVHDASGAIAALVGLRELLDSGDLRSASADLILGGPGQELEHLRSDVETIASIGLPHLSVYALTVEPNTPLAEQIDRGLARAPDELLQAEMLARLPDWLSGAGLSRYEVSNFARPGHESRHNRAYWTGRHYLAVGVGSHGFLPTGGAIGTRYGNHRDLKTWRASVLAGVAPAAFTEDIDTQMHVDERLLTGLRLAHGVDVSRWRGWLEASTVERIAETAAALQAAGHPIVAEGTKIRVVRDGWLTLNQVVLPLSEAAQGLVVEVAQLDGG